MIWKIVSRNVNYKVRDFLKKKKKSSQCSLINSNEFPFTEIKNWWMPYNSFKRHFVKQRFINKSPKQFACVSPASIPDTCAFYRVIINQMDLGTEKEGHNMQMSPLDLP